MDRFIELIIGVVKKVIAPLLKGVIGTFFVGALFCICFSLYMYLKNAQTFNGYEFLCYLKLNPYAAYTDNWNGINKLIDVFLGYNLFVEVIFVGFVILNPLFALLDWCDD